MFAYDRIKAFAGDFLIVFNACRAFFPASRQTRFRSDRREPDRSPTAAGGRRHGAIILQDSNFIQERTPQRSEWEFSIRGVDLWTSLKMLFRRAKEITSEYKDINK